jgi:mono/diheme cytochrome c family protein
MKFNPDYHSSVVRNLRTMWKRMPEGAPKELTLTDEEIWDIYEDWGRVDMVAEFDTSDEELEVMQLFGKDAAAMLALMDAQNEKEA